MGSEFNRISDMYYFLSINLHYFKWVVWYLTITFFLQPVQIFGRKMALSGHHRDSAIAELIMHFWKIPFKRCRWKSMPTLDVTSKHIGRWATGEAHMLERHASFSYCNMMAEGCYRWSCSEKITSLGFWQRKKSIKKAVLRAESFIENQQKPYRNGELLTRYQVPAFGHPDTL